MDPEAYFSLAVVIKRFRVWDFGAEVFYGLQDSRVLDGPGFRDVAPFLHVATEVQDRASGIHCEVGWAVSRSPGWQIHGARSGSCRPAGCESHAAALSELTVMEQATQT